MIYPQLEVMKVLNLESNYQTGLRLQPRHTAVNF